ncbi:Pyroglutamyl-peptidase 1-like protein [Lachnellula suecica]|uniref:Pyroglutamyl-peptidase 1-like protein n=1 Tax=Lachnellula suecica TaxID=602035 RepID=A0A8T9C3C7_9HELO|nr:Pyroglutamyl-peptidase 1-like protein [Lachnellula suecica]
MSEEQFESDLTVLVTGFSVCPFCPQSLFSGSNWPGISRHQTNPSFEIIKLLPAKLSHKGLTIRIITHATPLKAEYHWLLTTIPPILEENQPDIVLHIGLAVERNYFAIEKGAPREGYQQYPDVSRKVFTKAEGKKAWGKSPDRLESSIDFEDVVSRWKKSVQKSVDVRGSDDVGTYVCGFVYYLSLEHFWKRGDGEAKVVFFHAPLLKGEKELMEGKEITIGLIGAIAEKCMTSP